MSKVTHRERITSVTQQLSDGLRGLTREVTSSVQALQTTTQEVVREVVADVCDGLHESESLIGCEALADRQDAIRTQVRERLDGSASELETIRAETLGALHAAEKLQSEDACVVEAAVDQLSRTQTIADARHLQQSVLHAVQEGHRQLFIDNLALCVEQASLSIGFTDVSVSDGPCGETRVTATNEKGQTIVSEIRDDGGKDPSLASEVIGVFDDSCEKIMNRFEEALANEGVQVDGPTRERSTQGRCALDAARDFMRKKIKRSGRSNPETSDAGSSTSAQRRRRRQQTRKRQRH